MTLGEIRRRPTLPGRFQPSTISVLRLNFCVRDGNRWIPQAIVTGNIGLSRFPSHPQNRTGRFGSRLCSRRSLRLTMAPLAPLRHSFSNQLHGFGFAFGFTVPFRPLPVPSGRFRSLQSPSGSSVPLYCLFTITYCLSPRSSPRPISIIKLHTLPYFHR